MSHQKTTKAVRICADTIGKHFSILETGKRITRAVHFVIAHNQSNQLNTLTLNLFKSKSGTAARHGRSIGLNNNRNVL